MLTFNVIFNQVDRGTGHEKIFFTHIPFKWYKYTAFS